MSAPLVVVLFVCKVAIAGPPDQNADQTGSQNLEWATDHSMMTCRRNEIQLTDPAEGQQLNAQDDPAMSLHPNFADGGQCARAGARLAMDWDAQHRNSEWRVWRVGCPAPIVDLRTGRIIGYKLPECPHQDYVVCEQDSVI